MPPPDALLSLPDEPLILAVSGGRDSMVLLESAALAMRDRVAAVATFDHGTGEHATRASELVRRRACALGFRVLVGRAPEGLPHREAAWRSARWTFLARVAREHGATVVTAHTRDDLLETVVMRILRGAGARGLAAMLVPAARVADAVRIHRPFLDIGRAELARWAESHAVEWIEDPGNQSLRHLRNRVRLDLLPAMERARPGVGDELLALARRAAAVRATLDRCATELSSHAEDGTLVIAAPLLEGYDADALAALWPALAARVGLALDRRGTSRAAAFTIGARPGGTVPLSGGFTLVRRRDATGDVFLLGRTSVVTRAPVASEPERSLVPGARVGPWRFRLATETSGDMRHTPLDAWVAELPADAPLAVRAWRPGDRMRAGAHGTARRVKRFFADARVPGMDRAGWPVVLVAGEIVWIPGVRRSIAATDRSGRPGVRYVCERISD